MRTIANQAKRAKSFDEVLRLALADADAGGLTRRRWLRLASMMVGPAFAANRGRAALVPLVGPLPDFTVQPTFQIVQNLFTIHTEAHVGRNERSVRIIFNILRKPPLDDTRTVGSPGQRRSHLSFTFVEWVRLAGFYGFIALLHLLGWGLYLQHSQAHPSLVGLGLAAYMFGLRHAFDADHIAAVDDTVRYLLQKGKKPLGIGFFFSLGHSTIVLLLAVAIAFSASAIKDKLPGLQEIGGLIGASVSGVFLWIIGVLNLLVLLDILKVWRQAKQGTHSHAHLEQLLAQRGLLNRLFGGRLQQLMNHSWQMYPLGLLFGLGFDTASEVGLLAMTAGASAGDLPIGAVLSLPILFAAGMSIMDTTDGVLMSKAYDWAFLNPLRKIFYNITTTSLSVVIALVIGTIELCQVAIHLLHLRGGVFDDIASLDFGLLGYLIVGLFLVGWAVSVGLWKFRKLEERYGVVTSADSSQTHAHAHTHEGHATLSHPHLH